MDPITIILGIFPIVSVVVGIRYIIKYLKTNQKKFLIIGIVFTFVVPAVILLILFGRTTINSMVAYGPAPPEVHVAYGPSPDF